MAQATIYGTIDQAYYSMKSTSALGVTSKTTGIAGVNNGGSAIGFKATEDLGNGIKVYFQQEIGLKTEANGGPYSTTADDSTGDGSGTVDVYNYENRNSFVGISGAFGSLQVGRQYNLAFYNVIANDPMGFSGLASFAPALAGNPARTDQLAVYTLPSFVPGLNLQLGKAFGNTAVTSTNSLKTGDSTSWAANYSANGLYIGFTNESVIGTTDALKEKYGSVTATYDFGMAKVGYSTTKTTISIASLKGSATSITVPVGGGLSVYYNLNDLKTDDGAGTTAKYKGTQLGGNYALSKRSTVYLQTGRTKVDGATTATSGFAIGLLHGF
jgi:predicted porin